MIDLNLVPPQRPELQSSVVYQGRTPWPLLQAEPGDIEDIEPDEDAETQPSPEPRRHGRAVKFDALGDHIGEIARRVFGEPNRDLSTRQQLRFGTNGGRSVEIDGPKKGSWFDHEAGRGGGPLQLIQTFAPGVSLPGPAKDWLRDNLGIEIQGEHSTRKRRNTVAEYIYRDETGAPLFKKVRVEPKDFYQLRADGASGWAGGKGCMNGVRRVLYHLDRIAAAEPGEPVLFVEGEKDADNAAGLGYLATCNPEGGSKTKSGGPAKWRRDYTEQLKGRRVVVFPDNDEVGEQHARTVATELALAGCDVRILSLPDLPPKGDISDWIAAGGTRERLDGLIADAPLFEADTSPLPPDGDPQCGAGDLIIIDPDDPYPNARAFVRRHFTLGTLRTVQRHRGSTYQWTNGAYHEITEEDVRARLYEYLDRCRKRNLKGELQRVKPDLPLVTHHIDALRAATHIDDAIEAAAWLGEEPVDMPADEMLSMQNGILHLPSKSLIQHTPAFFTYNSLPFDYVPGAPEPTLWLGFLSSIWPDDQQSIDTLQEIFGLCLTRNTAFQKIFLILGPPRSGKGAIARTLRVLLGTSNVVGPTLASLAGEFGLEQLIGKLVAVVSDARMTGKTDSDAVVERLLNISGEDAVSVNRKNRTFWNGQLLVRVIMLANGLPRFNDPSGAFANRFIVLRIMPSFLGREDLTLGKRLLNELPGILNWSITGWERVDTRGYFIQPDSAAEDVKQMREMVSPIGMFVRECCITGVGFSVVKAELYESWKGWCHGQGRESGSASTFGRNLKEVVPRLREDRPGAHNQADRRERYVGIQLKPE